MARLAPNVQNVQIISPATSFPEILGSVVRHIRKEKGIGQGVIADTLGLSVSSWSRIESGQAPMTAVHFRCAADVLGHKAWQLMKIVEDVCAKIKSLSPNTVILADRPSERHVASGWFIGHAAVGALVTKILSKTSRTRK